MSQTPPAANAAADALAGGMDETVHHVSPRSRREVGSSKMQPNLSSMIDVIFQLLIYFVVTANFAVGEGVITAKLPQADEGAAATAAPPEKPLNILISSAGTYQYNIAIEGMGQAPRNFTELARLLESLQLNPANPNGSYKDDNPILIKPDGQVRWQHVVNAFNAAVKARYRNVSFAKPTQ